MALNGTVGRKGGSIAKTSVTATVTADKGEAGIKIVSSKLKVVAEGLQGVDTAQFAEVAREAEGPMSRCRTRSAGRCRSTSRLKCAEEGDRRRLPRNAAARPKAVARSA